MNKLLISLLSLTGVAGLSTGGYFLLRGSEEKSGQKETNGQLSPETNLQENDVKGSVESSQDGVAAAGAPGTSGSGDTGVSSDSEPNEKSNQDGTGSDGKGDTQGVEAAA